MEMFKWVWTRQFSEGFDSFILVSMDSEGLSGQVPVGLKQFQWVWKCFSGSGWVSMAFFQGTRLDLDHQEQDRDCNC